MLYIRAIDLVLQQIDSHLKIKLGMSPDNASLDAVEDTLSKSLCHAASSSVALEHKSDEEISSLVNSNTCDLASRNLRFNLTWGSFLDLGHADFEKQLVNLREHPLDETKLIVMLRLRKNIQILRDRAFGYLKEREQNPSSAGKDDSIDLALHQGVLGELNSAEGLAAEARTMKQYKPVSFIPVTTEPGKRETELLLARHKLLLTKYIEILKDIDEAEKVNGNRRYPLSHHLSLLDMIPLTESSRHPMVACIISRSRYLLENLDTDMEILAKKQGGYFDFKRLTHEPDTAADKRTQEARLLNDLFRVVRQDPENSTEKILETIDTHAGWANKKPSTASQYMFEYFRSQRSSDNFRLLHSAIMRDADPDVRQKHSCQAKGL